MLQPEFLLYKYHATLIWFSEWIILIWEKFNIQVFLMHKNFHFRYTNKCQFKYIPECHKQQFLERQHFKVRIPCYRILRFVHLQFRACHNSYYRPPGPVLKSTIWYYIPCVPKCQRRRRPHITNQTWTIVRRKTSIVLKQNWISSIRNYQEFWRNANVCWYQPCW